jgi:hypothetical protein
MGITPEGVDRVEERRRQTAELTPEAVAVVPLALRVEIEAFAGQLSAALQRGEFDSDPDVRLQLEADLETVNAQARSPKPKRQVMAAIFKGLAVVLREARAGVLGGIAFELARKLSGY